MRGTGRISVMIASCHKIHQRSRRRKRLSGGNVKERPDPINPVRYRHVHKQRVEAGLAVEPATRSRFSSARDLKDGCALRHPSLRCTSLRSLQHLNRPRTRPGCFTPASDHTTEAPVQQARDGLAQAPAADRSLHSNPFKVVLPSSVSQWSTSNLCTALAVPRGTAIVDETLKPSSPVPDYCMVFKVGKQSATRGGAVSCFVTCTNALLIFHLAMPHLGQPPKPGFPRDRRPCRVLLLVRVLQEPRVVTCGAPQREIARRWRFQEGCTR